jgi:hypothetical protein
METVAKIKLYGERNTGTTWLRQLITLNLEVETYPGAMPEWVRRVQNVVPGTDWVRDLWFRMRGDTIFGWKHQLVDPSRMGFVERALEQRVGFVCLVKHPAAWVMSLHRRPYDHHWGPVGDLDAFVKSPWYTVDREHASPVYPDPISMWNAKCRAYLTLAERLPTMLVRYEDLVADPMDRIDDIAGRFGIKKRSGFRNQESSTKRDDRKFEDYRDYYARERWREELPSRIADEITARVDDTLLQTLGYRP